MDVTIRHAAAEAAREIKASAHYSYIVNGITLDGSKFAVGELVKEGTCVVKDNATGMYEKYTETTAGTFQPGKSDPVILDESIKFAPDDNGENPDVTAGQVLVHGSVYNGMLIGATQAFKDKLAGAIRFV
jgi:hypothetical protein